MTQTTTGARAAFRLNNDDIERVSKITAALTHPHRDPPSLSEVFRVAIRSLSDTLSMSLPR